MTESELATARQVSDALASGVANLDQRLVAFAVRWWTIVIPAGDQAGDPQGQSAQINRIAQRALLVLAGRDEACGPRFRAAVRWTFPEEDAPTWAALLLGG